MTTVPAYPICIASFVSLDCRTDFSFRPNIGFSSSYHDISDKTGAVFRNSNIKHITVTLEVEQKLQILDLRSCILLDNFLSSNLYLFWTDFTDV